MNKLEQVIDYINDSTSSFRMKDIKNTLVGHLIYDTTISNYVNQINLCYFTKRIDRGVYIKIKDIPTDLTVSKLKYMTYDKNYKRLLKIKQLMNND